MKIQGIDYIEGTRIARVTLNYKDKLYPILVTNKYEKGAKLSEIEKKMQARITQACKQKVKEIDNA